jgi:hypothetical protein
MKPGIFGIDDQASKKGLCKLVSQVNYGTGYKAEDEIQDVGGRNDISYLFVSEKIDKQEIKKCRD